jgi:ferredoxin
MLAIIHLKRGPGHGVDRSRPRPPEAGPAAKRNCTAGRKGARKTASSHVAHVVPADVDIEVLDGETLFDASWREGYDWPTVCIGQMLCTACHVIVKEGIENVEPMVEVFTKETKRACALRANCASRATSSSSRRCSTGRRCAKTRDS